MSNQFEFFYSMDTKIGQVNKKLIRTFDRLNYKVDIDENADNLMKLNILANHVYKLYIQKQLEAQSQRKKEIQAKKVCQKSNTEERNSTVVEKCCDRAVELAEVFIVLLKLLNKGNEENLRNCLAQFKTLIEEIQSALTSYETTDPHTNSKIEQLKKISFKSQVNIVEIPEEKAKNFSTKIISTYSPSLGARSDESIQNVEELKEEIDVLNEALIQNNKQYMAKMKAYNEKLAYMQEEIQELKNSIHIYERNERTFQYELERHKNQKIQDELLIKNMTRKIRKLESGAEEGKWPQYNCPQLSRERGNSRNSRSRLISVENGHYSRIPSVKKSVRVETHYY